MAEEKQFENKVKRFLTEKEIWYLKTWSNGIQRKGVPDLLICCNGYFVGVELKAEYGKPSELQKWNIEKIRDAGGIGIIVYPHQYEMFKNLIHSLLTDDDPEWWLMNQEYAFPSEVKNK